MDSPPFDGTDGSKTPTRPGPSGASASTRACWLNAGLVILFGLFSIPPQAVAKVQTPKAGKAGKTPTKKSAKKAAPPPEPSSSEGAILLAGPACPSADNLCVVPQEIVTNTTCPHAHYP